MTKKEMEKKIIELEGQVAVLKELLSQRIPQQINIPSVWTTPQPQECDHVYDYVFGTPGQVCRKCGRPPFSFTVTCNSTQKVYDDKAWESWNK